MVAVKELNSSYYTGETLLFAIYIYIYICFNSFSATLNPCVHFIFSSYPFDCPLLGVMSL